MPQLPHEDDCIRGNRVQIDRLLKRIRVHPSFSQRWSCPGCASYKFGKATEHLPALHPLLSISPFERRKQITAKRRNLGMLLITYEGGFRVMVSEPTELIGEISPALSILHSIVADPIRPPHSITRLGWNDRWRVDKPTDSTRYINITTDKPLPETLFIVENLCPDGLLGAKSPDVVHAILDQSLNGASFS